MAADSKRASGLSILGFVSAMSGFVFSMTGHVVIGIAQLCAGVVFIAAGAAAARKVLPSEESSTIREK
jgi:hypothetical protein